MKIKAFTFITFLLLIIGSVAKAQTTVSVKLNSGTFTADPAIADFTKPVTVSCAGGPKNFKVVKKTGDLTVSAKDASNFTLAVNDTKLPSIVVTLSSDDATKPFDLTIKNKDATPSAPVLGVPGPNQIFAQIDGGVIAVAPVPASGDFTKPIVVTCKDGFTNFKVVKKSGDINIVSTDATHYTINVNDAKQASVTITLSADNAPAPLDVKINSSAGNPDNTTTASKKSYTEKARAYFSKTVPAFNNFYRYDRSSNQAYFFFDQNGVLIGPAPVNIDADDYLQIYVAVPETSSGDYAIEAVGEYSPSDLNLAPHDAIAVGAAQGTGVSTEDKLTYIHQTLGPFTSDNVTVKIYGKPNANGDNVLKQQSVKINKLYNAAVGVTFISTTLANPDFDVVPLTGTTNNTIKKVNDGTRTMVAFNVTYFWKPTVDWITGKLKGSDHITRGRDILKEATFWERLNPSFGVALSDKWKENFFLGGNFEFTRGGSITAGWHYGKVQSLLDENFKLGQDAFTGTQNDIKLTNSWKWAGFIGLTVDTRIFNALFSHN